MLARYHTASKLSAIILRPHRNCITPCDVITIAAHGSILKCPKLGGAAAELLDMAKKKRIRASLKTISAVPSK
jgi:hypothetical protein